MASRLPKRFQAASIKDLNKKPYRKRFDFVVEYLAGLKDNIRHGRGLLVAGPNGVGKTWALAALTRAAQVQCSKLGLRFDFEFVSAPDLFDRYPTFAYDRNEERDSRRGQTWRDTIHTVPWLIIDDLSKENRAGQLEKQVTYKLGRILRERSQRMLVTHITTQLSFEKEDTIQALYGNSINSLLAETVEAHVVTGSDRRRSK